MKDLIIIGASGFGREVAWHVERINQVKPTWNLLGFIDDNPELHGQEVNDYVVLGGCDKVNDYKEAYYICAIGASKVRRNIIEKIETINKDIKYATIIDPTSVISNRVFIGEGTIICAFVLMTVGISLGKHIIITSECVIGHDAIINDYVTMYPSVNISGTTQIGECVEMGTGSKIIQGKKIGENSIVGAGALIINNIDKNCTVVGVPAKTIKHNDEVKK